MKITTEERVHKICELLEKGTKPKDICQMVEHDHCTDEVFMSYIVAIRNGVARKEISSIYNFNRPTYNYIRKLDSSAYKLTDEIIELVRDNELTNPQIVNLLYIENDKYTKSEFYNFVARTRTSYLKNQDRASRKNNDTLFVK